MNSVSDHSEKSALSKIAEKLQALEERVTQLEKERKRFKQKNEEDTVEFKPISFNIRASGGGQFESSIGEYGLAWLGNIVLFFGIIFIVQYFNVSGPVFLSPLIGYAAIAGIFILSHYLRISNSYMSKLFRLNAYILAYIVTLKLHFFNTSPILGDKVINLILIFAVSGAIMFIAIRQKYAVLTGISLILLTFSGLMSDAAQIILILAILISAATIFLVYKLGWIKMVFLSVTLVYLSAMLWMMNNPLAGNQFGIINSQQGGIIYIFSAAAVFSLLPLIPGRDDEKFANQMIGAVIYNGLGFTFTMTLLLLSFYQTTYYLPAGFIALYCIGYSIVLKMRSKSPISASIYALFGFVVLSVAFYGYYNFPRAYFLLAIQSLLVLSMAIWFRSRFIVVMNSFLYLILLMVYLATAAHGDAMNISFSLVALITARVLNWKKEFLTIRTEYIRNFYLITAFFMVLFTMHHLVPGQYVTLSWTMAALVYFLLNLALKNVKYRYMALGTMIAAALYLFIVDLARIELLYRIIALLFLALISIGLSIYYAKKLKKKPEEATD